MESTLFNNSMFLDKVRALLSMCVDKATPPRPWIESFSFEQKVSLVSKTDHIGMSFLDKALDYYRNQSSNESTQFWIQAITLQKNILKLQSTNVNLDILQTCFQLSTLSKPINDSRFLAYEQILLIQLKSIRMGIALTGLLNLAIRFRETNTAKEAMQSRLHVVLTLLSSLFLHLSVELDHHDSNATIPVNIIWEQIQKEKYTDFFGPNTEDFPLIESLCLNKEAYVKASQTYLDDQKKIRVIEEMSDTTSVLNTKGTSIHVEELINIFIHGDVTKVKVKFESPSKEKPKQEQDHSLLNSVLYYTGLSRSISNIEEETEEEGEESTPKIVEKTKRHELLSFQSKIVLLTTICDFLRECNRDAFNEETKNISDCLLAAVQSMLYSNEDKSLQFEQIEELNYVSVVAYALWGEYIQALDLANRFKSKRCLNVVLSEASLKGQTDIATLVTTTLDQID